MGKEDSDPFSEGILWESIERLCNGTAHALLRRLVRKTDMVMAYRVDQYLQRVHTNEVAGRDVRISTKFH
jgi:hypothetical protein